MKATELLADKKNTRAILAELVEKRYDANMANMAEFRGIAERLSEAIGDVKSSPYAIREQENIVHPLQKAIDRACEFIAEARKVPGLEAGIANLNEQMENMRRLIDTTIEERTRAQEAAALVGATFNDYREANAADKMVEVRNTIGDCSEYFKGNHGEFVRLKSDGII